MTSIVDDRSVEVKLPHVAQASSRSFAATIQHNQIGDHPTHSVASCTDKVLL